MVFLSSTTVGTFFPLIATILSRLYRLVPPGEIESGFNLPDFYQFHLVVQDDITLIGL